MGTVNKSTPDEYPCLESNKAIQNEQQNENNGTIESMIEYVLGAILKRIHLEYSIVCHSINGGICQITHCNVEQFASF